MSKSNENTTDELVEADFRQLKKLLHDKYGKEYTTEYIRKVCKGKRQNSEILAMAQDYIEFRSQMESKMARLAS